MKKTSLLFLILSFLMGLFTMASAADEKRYDVPLGDGPVLGPADAPVTIIEFLDFQ